MPRPVPLPVRQAIWNRFQAGQDALSIAEAMGLPILRRFPQKLY